VPRLSRMEDTMNAQTLTVDRGALERASAGLHTALIVTAGQVAADGGERPDLLAALRHLVAAMDAVNAALRALDA
jgi:hypothetical protein